MFFFSEISHPATCISIFFTNHNCATLSDFALIWPNSHMCKALQWNVMWCVNVNSSSHLSKLISSLSHQLFGGAFFLPASKRVENGGLGGQHQKCDVDAHQMIWERRLHQSVTIWQIQGRARLSALSSLGNWEPSCTTVLGKVHQLCNPGSQCTFGTKLHYCTTVLYKVHLGNWGISCTIVQCK